jgi:hypothetical protein
VVLAFAGLSYLSAVVSGYLAVVSPLFHTELAALDALAAAVALALACGALFAVDALLERRRRATRPRLIAL